MIRLRPAPSIKQDAPARARALVEKLPRLVLEARHVASGLLHGTHGRHRSGSGSDFWAYRRLTSGEPASGIDWRRSARDSHLSVREQEWESQQTVWLALDQSASMRFSSHPDLPSRQERMYVLALALAAVIGRNGERVGVAGIMPPSSAPDMIGKIADHLAQHPPSDASPSLPDMKGISPRSCLILFTDALMPLEDLRTVLIEGRSRTVTGHIVELSDPAESLFPYHGRMRFDDPETGEQIMLAEASSLRQAYLDRRTAHLEALRGQALELGWSVTSHRTDHSATTALLHLHGLLRQRRP